MFRPFGGTPSGTTTPFGTPQNTQNTTNNTGFQPFGMTGPSSQFGGAATTSGFSSGGSGFGATPRYSTTNDMENNVTITLQAITAMAAYQKQNFEELRLEDYAAGRKGATLAPYGAVGTGMAQNSTFGITSSGGAAGLFGNTNTGTSQANPFGGTSGGGIFGTQPPAPTSQTTFGGTSSGNLFGTSAVSAPPAFSGFGQQQQQPSGGGLFGTAPTTLSGGSLFGNTTQQQQQQQLAQPTSGFSAFGKPNTVSSGTTGFGGFGTQPGGATAAGTATGGSNLFGVAPVAPNTTATSNGIFGSKPPTTTTGFSFGSNPSFPPPSNTNTAFGTVPPGVSGNLFGQQTNQAPTTTNVGGGGGGGGGGGLFNFGNSSIQAGGSNAAIQPQSTSTGGGFSFGQPQSAQNLMQPPPLFGNQLPSTTTTTTTGGGAPTSSGGGFSFNFGGAATGQPTTGAGNTGGFSFGSGNMGTTTIPMNNSMAPSTLTTTNQQPTGGFSFNFGGGGSGTNNNTFGLGLNPISNSAQSQSQSLPLISAESLSIKPPIPVALATPQKTFSETPTGTGGKLTFTGRSPARFTPRTSFRLQPPSEVSTSSSSYSSTTAIPIGPSNFTTGFVLPRRVSAKKLVVTSNGEKLVEVNSSRLTTPSRAESIGFVGEFRSSSFGAHNTGGNETVQTGKGQLSEGGGTTGEKYMIPGESTLRKLPYAQLSAVQNFTLGERGIGQVRFLQPVDLTKIAISDIFGKIVVFEPRLITLYPDDEFDIDEKPPVGTGLNLAAEVRLDRCWCVSKADRQPIKDMGDPRLQTHIARLKVMPDTTFVDYIPESGTWIFRVEHFSSYGPDWKNSKSQGERRNSPSIPNVIGSLNSNGDDPSLTTTVVDDVDDDVHQKSSIVKVSSLIQP